MCPGVTPISESLNQSSICSDVADWRQVLRRMVFLSSRNLIQSEAVLRPRHPLLSHKQQRSGTSAKTRQNGNAALSAAAQQLPANGSSHLRPAAGAQVEVDHSQLPCGYHVAIVAGLALLRAPLIRCFNYVCSLTQRTARAPTHPSCACLPLGDEHLATRG